MDENDFKLDFSRMMNQTPRGGVPGEEFLAAQYHFAVIGLNPYNLFRKRLTGLTPAEAQMDGIYALYATTGSPIFFDFSPLLATRDALRPAVESDAGVQARRAKLQTLFADWWKAYISLLALLPDPDTSLAYVRKTMLRSFVELVGQSDLLSDSQLEEVIGGWWDEVEGDLQAVDQGCSFLALVDQWIAKRAPEELSAAVLITHQEGEEALPAEREALMQRVCTAGLGAVRAELTEEAAGDITIAVEHVRLATKLERSIDAQVQVVVALVESWWDKYRA